MDKFKMVLDFASKQTNLGFGLVALLTAGGEQIFSSVVFKCPCNKLNFIYGLIFLLVPALALLILGFLLTKKTWKLVTGVCQRKEKVCGSCKRVAVCGTVLFQIGVAALVAPSTWIAVALLNGNFLECAMTGANMSAFNNHLCNDEKTKAQCVKELPLFPCGKESAVSKDEREMVLLMLRAESQIMGWVLIAFIFVSQLLLICFARCTSPISYLQLKFWRLYAQEESSLMDSYAASHAQELAERNMKSFFQKAPAGDVKTPSNHDWERISLLYKFSKQGQYYSTLHQFVERSETREDPLMRTASVKSTGSQRLNPAALSFVDGGQASV